MALISWTRRVAVTDFLQYTRVVGGCGCPGGIYAGRSICRCRGCLGLGGDCQHGIRGSRVLVSFSLDDGRSGTVDVGTAATDQDISAAISGWAAGNPPPRDPLRGVAV